VARRCSSYENGWSRLFRQIRDQAGAFCCASGGARRVILANSDFRGRTGGASERHDGKASQPILLERCRMRVPVLVAAAALHLAAPAAAQTSTDPNMPVAPAGLGDRITMGTQSFEPAYNPAGYQIAPSQLRAAQVRQLQQALRAQGYPVTRIDGRFGPETAGAMQSFQQRQNIPSPPGQVDARALGMLGVGVSPAAPGGAAPGR